MGDTNAQNDDIAVIRDALGLSESGYEIVRENSFYVIQPVSRNRLLHIAPIMSAEIFSQYNLEFRNCAFDNLHFTNETIKKKIRFQRCTFKKCTLDRCVFKKIVNFNFGNLKGSCKGNFVCTDTVFEDIAYFIKLTFEGRANFSRSRFKERAFFSESTFNDNADFTEVIFDNNSYFDETKFKEEAIFQQSEFYKNAHFYQTIFQKIPNFVQVIFNENINFTNTDLNITSYDTRKKLERFYVSGEIEFDNIRDKIERTYNERKNKDIRESKKHKIANEFRDSFRNIKSPLIEHHNMLDASNYHRYELYCKELELEYRRKEKAENSGIRDIIDRIQLYCYRITSDHHTDLLLILNYVVFLIALFGCINLVFVMFLYCYDVISSILWSLISCAMFVMIALYFMLEPKNNRHYMGIIKILVIIIELFISGILAGICGIMVMFFIESVGIFNLKAKRIFMLFLSYCIVLFTLISQPSFLMPILGKIIDIEKTNVVFAFESLNIVYTIFLFLLLFSLQKTARKNTIIPN
ncbi:MAG: pentapeptide repeat-containing protein [Helicobacter sp.]|nr:pentapeptide repeat-containing protein [Helicobacter sp.]